MPPAAPSRLRFTSNAVLESEPLATAPVFYKESAVPIVVPAVAELELPAI